MGVIEYWIMVLSIFVWAVIAGKEDQPDNTFHFIMLTYFLGALVGSIVVLGELQ